jgi:hypothetical protein
MKKKEYMQPSMLVVELNMNAQILAGSMTGINVTGLEEELELVDDPGDIGDAMSRNLDDFEDFEDENF